MFSIPFLAFHESGSIVVILLNLVYQLFHVVGTTHIDARFTSDAISHAYIVSTWSAEAWCLLIELVRELLT